MKRTLLICVFALGISLLHAQKIYFIYFQTEAGDPFFIRMNDKLYSSTSSGYLILSKLIDSTYKFKLGFPGKNIDLDFTTTMNKKDHGYLIKDFGDKGWGLFDLQSLNIQMSSSPVKSNAGGNSGSLQVTAFTDLLARATDDPSLKQNVVFAKEDEGKTQVVEAVEKSGGKLPLNQPVESETRRELVSKPDVNAELDKAAHTVIEQNIDSSGKLPVAKVAEPYKRSRITKLSGTATADGFKYVFRDENSNGNADTIAIVVPHDTRVVNAEPKPDSTKEIKKTRGADTSSVAGAQAAAKKDEAKKWGLFNKSRNESVNKSSSETDKEGMKKWWPFSKNSSTTASSAQIAGSKTCATVAVDDDFLKLRRKMAGRTNDDGMLEEAKKYFKMKCFTTEQIKNLSSMFLSSAGKLNFFEIAKDYTSDKDKFSSLESELKDPYYVNQFRAMLSN